MNATWVFLQSALSGDLAHVLLDLLVAACSSLFALFGGLIFFMVKRAIRQNDEWKAGVNADIAALKSAVGVAAIEAHRAEALLGRNTPGSRLGDT